MATKEATAGVEGGELRGLTSGQRGLVRRLDRRAAVRSFNRQAQLKLSNPKANVAPLRQQVLHVSFWSGSRRHDARFGRL